MKNSKAAPMPISLTTLMFSSALVLLALPLAQAAVISVNGNTNNAAISQMTYLVDNVLITQSVSTTTNTDVSIPVLVDTINVATGPSTTKTLAFYNSVNAIIRNNNFVPTTGVSPIPGSIDDGGGVGVYNTVAPTRVRIQNDGLAAYENAVIQSSIDTNLMNYLFYDGTLQNMPPPGVADFDVLFYNAWTTDDHIVVAERNGNTFFELTPLGADGNPIAGANSLLFGTGSPPHDWDSGYVNSFDLNTNQSMWLTAASISKFFEGTAVPLADHLVYGYRIDNEGNADVKFFGASDTTFTDNPINPLVPVPEPGSLALLLGASAAWFLLRRRRLGRPMALPPVSPGG